MVASAPCVAILGTGIAGLTAADWLSTAGVVVSMFDARGRPGGRIHSLPRPPNSFVIELGAEFVHGEHHDTWRTAKYCPAFDPLEFPDRHWEWRDGQFSENRHFWNNVGDVLDRLEDVQRDDCFAHFLRGVTRVPREHRALAKDYVEGFHAAETERVSIAALQKAEESAEETNGQKQFRLRQGYGAIVDWLVERLRKRDVTFHFNCPIAKVQWEHRRVELFSANEVQSLGTFDAAVITLPIGVLQARAGEPGAVIFAPDLKQKRRLIAQIEMGNVVKVTLVFRKCVLPEHMFGFIHAHDKCFPTWWSAKDDNTIVAWTGGPKADALNHKEPKAVIDVALRELAEMLRLSNGAMQSLLENAFFHDWRNDPFSRGAYSYLPVGATHVPQQIATPIENTLFFAGEALAPPGQGGTVHGAIASAKQTAKWVLAGL